MEKSKTEQYTFGPNEKEILEILAAFENEFGKLPNGASIEYYEDFAIKGMKDFEISGVFMVKIPDEKGNISYHLYYQSPSNEILSIDHEGNIKIDSKWKEAIGDIDFESTMEINNEDKERLKGISEKTTPEEIQKKLEKKKDDKEQQGEKEEDKPEEQIQKDIGGEDLDISYYRPITDNSFDEQIGMNLNKYEEIGLAYSKAHDAFILVGCPKDGQFQRVDGFKEAQPTYKTVMSIDEKGQNVEKKVPHALMQTKNSKKELSVTIGQWGYIEVATVDRLPCDTRVTREVGEKGEGEAGRTSPELNRVIKEEGTEGLHDWIHQNEEKHEQMEHGEDRKGDIAEEISRNQVDDEYIPGTDVKWIDFANNCGYRGEDGIEYAKKIFEEEQQKNPDKTSEELVNDIVKGKEDEYQSPEQTY